MNSTPATPVVTSSWARATGRLELDLPSASLPQLVLAAAARAPQFTVADVQPHGATVQTGVSAFSWGGNITLQFSARGESTSAIDARLVPHVPTNVIDFGQSKRTLTEFLTTVAATIPR